MSNSLDPDQDRHYVGPDLDSNCLQALSGDGISMQRVGREMYRLRCYFERHKKFESDSKTTCIRNLKFISR